MKNKKVLGVKNYNSIPHLSTSRLGEHDKFIHIGQEKLLTEKVRDKHDKVIVTIKYDGCNVGIVKTDNGIIAVTKSGYRCDESKHKQHRAFASYVAIHKEAFNNMMEFGDRIVGEWLHTKHSLDYDFKGLVLIRYSNAKYVKTHA